ncbi:hypothetical protein GCK32_009451 [Trichostrongylus colubriformis]|uniref:Ground-like domain-containing protein n=1 Tax=Trichostrongylus colubriformis TaxID=6319 RepID=A0AAN8FEB1_TRICO
MLLLLLLLCFATCDASQRPNLKFPDHAKRLQDEPLPELPSPFGNKVYLKNKLLSNLNHFFPDPEETLEILEAPDTSPHEHPVETNSIIDSPIVTESPTETTFFSPIQNLLENTFTQRAPDRPAFPTLIPKEVTIAPFEASSPAIMGPTSTKKRSEGPIVSERVLDSIRDWRKRLYRAFKSARSNRRLVDNKIQTRSTTPTKPTSEVVDLKDLTPLVIDKNRQVILSRKEPGWQSWQASKKTQTFGREPNGKLTRLFGTEASGYHSKPLNDSPPAAIPNDYLSPLSTNRKAYRTPGGRNVVFIPASHITIPPPPITAPAVTLPPLVTLPYPPASAVPDYTSSYNTQERPQYNTFSSPVTQNYAAPNLNLPAPQVITLPPLDSYTTPPPPTDSDLEGEEDVFDSECTGELSCMNGQLVSEDKCNSLRLRTIIQNNIVPNDAEASKRAVQSAAESETGLFFDAICGTGFFSYIAHTDEFCLASVAGVNCYVFSPVCSEASPASFSRLRKSSRKVYVNRN